MIGTDAPPLTVDQAILAIRRRPGVIPVDIDPGQKRLVWMDIGDTPLVESYFFRSTQQLLEQSPDVFHFSTGLDILDEDDIAGEGCYPTAFVYHMGRSGSTLLSRALSAIPAHLVISEAPPHFFIWPLLTDGWQADIPQDERTLRRFRNLTLAMARKRRNAYRRHFVKFTTYNVLFIPFIQAAFPDVPALFLCRHPAEVLVAMAREGPGWRRMKDTDFGAVAAGCSIADVRRLSELAFYARCLNRFMTAAYRASHQGLALANYALLRPDRLSLILAAIDCRPGARDLRLMQAQFDFHAKDDDSDRRPFVPDSEEKRQAVTHEIEALVWPTLVEHYRKLEDAAGNLDRRPQ